MGKRVSIKDIAKEMQVAISTVSAVLNGKAVERRISIELKNKILAYTEQIGYKPNLLARSLRTGKSNLIGMLVEDISDMFFASIAREMERKAAQINYKIFFASTENNLEITRSLIKTFLDRQVDAYIIAPPPGLEKEITSLEKEGHPVIVFDRHFPELDTSNVLVDNFRGTYGSIEYLIKKGKRNIGLVTLNSGQSQMMARLDAYKQGMKEIDGLELILKIDYQQEEDKVVTEISEYIRQHKKIDAILFTTNYLTVSGLKAIKKLQINIPQTIAVIGFDDNTNFSLYTPTITAVSQPIKEIAAAILSQLTTRLEPSSSVEKNTILLPTKLILRESV